MNFNLARTGEPIAKAKSRPSKALKAPRSSLTPPSTGSQMQRAAPEAKTKRSKRKSCSPSIWNSIASSRKKAGKSSKRSRRGRSNHRWPWQRVWQKLMSRRSLVSDSILTNSETAVSLTVVTWAPSVRKLPCQATIWCNQLRMPARRGISRMQATCRVWWKAKGSATWTQA